VIDGKTFKLEEEDIIVSIAPKDGWAFENSGSDFVALDSRLTDELILEGQARELINKIQYTRKENNFDVMDRIKVIYYADNKLREVINKYYDYITSETLTNEFISLDEEEENMKKWDINGIEMKMKLVRSEK
jgi:isoleucyl-tRNA synthetase